jgi:DNA replication protein DnaC
MLNHPTLDKLETLRFTGMAKALTEQIALPDIEALSFEERLGLLVDREMTEREDRRLKTRLRKAKLKQNACVEDMDFRQPRSLDKSLILDLSHCQWIKQHLNLLITGPTGVGKTWIACALAQKSCREGYSALYLRLPRLLQELPIAKGDGTYTKLLTRLAKIDVLILDDWGLSKLVAEQRRDLLEILEDRHDNRSTIVTSQLPLDKWHHMIGDPTLADAILDRLVHNAYKINLKGESMRKRKSKLTTTTESE